MGLIHAIAGAAGGVLADSWRDFFYCDADALNENEKEWIKLAKE